MNQSIPQPPPFPEMVRTYIVQYLTDLDGAEPIGVYALFMEQTEKALLEQMLLHTRGNQSQVAKICDLSRGTLRNRLKDYGLHGSS